MRVPSIYLETTMFNFPFSDDAPQYKADTLRLFAEIDAGKFRSFTLKYVIRELDNATDLEKREQMKTLDEYLKDPDIAEEPAAMREVHAIRLMIQDETKGMTASERTAYYNSNTEQFLSSYKPEVVTRKR